MGIHGSNVAAENECSREAQDAYAVRSHQSGGCGLRGRRMQDEIVPVELNDRTGNVTLFERDEAIRAPTPRSRRWPSCGRCLTKVARLRPATLRA